ncbi:MAG: YceI family protein, partial [Ferruginibacter sp.]
LRMLFLFFKNIFYMKQLFFIAALFSATLVQAQVFIPTDEGSKLHFVIKNFAVNTGGDISGMEGRIIFDASKPGAAGIDVKAKVSTIDTDNEKRDNHLKNEDFFDAEKYPDIRIQSTRITKGADLKRFNFSGNLTIKGKTKKISFPFTAEGKNGGALFTGNFEILRSDFGIGKESATMSDKVKVSLSVFAKAG